ncbi:FMN-binding domain-containing protein [Paenibacillus odorifer]|uniref:FMN-binding protein n=1 Tax=Paenibacillus odorifer TaxID=189426 RepID=UPI00096F2835|nr:FMN-binding protein [Paenibacillus odorifer]OMD63137.1 FMN-binding domain-containing protein [Paenibacillus odorifer]
MKKLISLTVSAAILLAPFAYTLNVPAVNLKVDAVSAASEEADAPAAKPTAKPTAKPAATPKATAKPVATPKPTAKPTATPKPTAKPTATPKATAKPAATPKATAAPVATPKATAAPAATVVPAETVKPVATAKPVTVNENVYQDGVYVAYGDAYSKGTEGAKIEIKDGKITSIELLRTSPKLIDRDARNNYSALWQAYGLMKDRLLGKTRDGAAAVDAVSGATRSSNGWKLSVDRAFERALSVKDTNAVYFDGVHMGVDPTGKYSVFATYESNKLTDVKVNPMNSAGDFIEEKAYTAEQAAAVAAIAPALLAKGTEAQPVAGLEADFKAAINAFWDAEQNAIINNTSAYVDGFYSSYGTARSVGVERADIVIRNGKLVDVKLFRLGNNLIDRGATAYAEVVKANAPMTAKLLANGSYIANYDEKVDGISGATESSHSWNQAVERAFEKALKVPAEGQYFDGKFAGVDNQSKVLLLVDVDADAVTGIKVSLFGADGKLIADDKLSAEQKGWVATLTSGLLEKGVQMADITGQEALSAAAKAALTDALNNASKVQGTYKDGTFTAFGDAYDKGTNRADVTLRNGKIVNVALYRVGMNLVDRGNAAYPEVVKAIPQLTASFLAAGTREGVQEVDAVSGATSSSVALKTAVDRAYGKAEVVEANKAAYFDGIFIGVSADKLVNVMVNVEYGVPVKMLVYYLDKNGSVRTINQLTDAELAVKGEIESTSTGYSLHKYGYRPAAFGKNDAEKEISAKAVEAIKSALESAGK